MSRPWKDSELPSKRYEETGEKPSFLDEVINLAGIILLGVFLLMFLSKMLFE